MKIKSKKMWLSCCLIMSFFYAAAQLNLLNEAQKIQLAYKAYNQIGFSLSYTYTDAANPAEIIDSASGRFIINGTTYWGKINGMEFMQNQNHAVQVVEGASLIRVALPDSTSRPVVTASILDSVLDSGTYTSAITSQGILRTITLRFKDIEAPFSFFTVTYDTTNYLLQKIEMEKAELDEDTDEVVKKMFTMHYTNYSFEKPASSIFLSSRYFIKNGTTFTAQPPFENYQVFIASPELTN